MVFCCCPKWPVVSQPPDNRCFGTINPPNSIVDMFPIPSMYGIFTYIWLIFRVNVGKDTSPMDAMGL